MNGALVGTTEFDIFSIDPATCRETWRTHEDYVPAQILQINRGAAYMDGLLFRGTAKSGEYVTQVMAIGPLGLEYVHPDDDSRGPRR